MREGTQGVLYLDIRRGESIIVTLPDGRTGTIEAKKVGADKIRMFFDFAPDVVIDRREVYERKKRQASHEP